MQPQGSGPVQEVTVKPYMRNGRLVRASKRKVRRRLDRPAAIGAKAGQVAKAAAGAASAAASGSAEKAKFLATLNAQMKTLGVKPADFKPVPGGAAGKNDRAQAALVNSLRGAGYSLNMSEDEGTGVATSADGKRKINVGMTDMWDGATYFTKDGVAMDNRTRKPRDFSQPGKPGYPRKSTGV